MPEFFIEAFTVIEADTAQQAVDQFHARLPGNFYEYYAYNKTKYLKLCRRAYHLLDNVRITVVPNEIDDSVPTLISIFDNTQE